MSLSIRRTLCAVALATALCGMTACGSQHTAKAAATSATSAPSSPALASAAPSVTPSQAGAAPLTEEQLTAVADALTKAGARGLTEDTSVRSTGVTEEKDDVSSGGPACQTFMDAMASYAPTYASSAEVDRGYEADTTNGREEVLVTLVSHASPAQAHHAVEDLRTSATSCPHLTAALDDMTSRMNLAPMTQPTLGDDSAVVRIGLEQPPTLITTALTQVGSTTVNVFVVSPKAYDPGVPAQVTKEVITLLHGTLDG